MGKADHTGQPEETKVACDYEKMNDLLYAYRFGTISFLDLLAAFEEILHIKTHANQSDAA
jgi:hypothetical protein